MTGQDALDQHLEDAVAGRKPGAFEWRHSSWCNGGACVEVACVEVASLGEMIAVRDSANADGVVLTFSNSSWQDFVADVKTGKLELAG